MYGHICRSHSSATLAPESLANEAFPKLTRVYSSADIAQRYSDINSPTRWWPRNKPYYWPLTSNLCSIVSNYFYYPLFRSYWPSYRSYLLETNWYNRKYDRYQYLPSDPYYKYVLMEKDCAKKVKNSVIGLREAVTTIGSIILISNDGTEDFELAAHFI